MRETDTESYEHEKRKEAQMRIEAKLKELGLTLPKLPKIHQECKYLSLGYGCMNTVLTSPGMVLKTQTAR